MRVRIVFLDFDGVLNSGPFLRATKAAGLDPLAVERLNELLARTGASVVISSSWRLGSTFDELIALLTSLGFKGEVLGVTPWLSDSEYVRGDEIQAWLDASTSLNIESFVILDDDQDMAHLNHRLVRTDFELGLTQADVERAVALFG